MAIDLSSIALDATYSPIKEPSGWSFDVPEGAKEAYLNYSKGLIRRVLLIKKNEAGVYDCVEMYRNKKSDKPIAILPLNVFVQDIVDEAIVDEKAIPVTRSMRVLEIAPDGSNLRMWMSPAMDFNNDQTWHPKGLLKEIVDNVGYPVPIGAAGSGDVRLIGECTRESWEQASRWTASCIKYLIKAHEYKLVYSHFHNVDLQGHLLVQYLRKGLKDTTPEQMQELFKQVYLQTDRYLAQYMELLDEGWTILIVSDHGQVCPEHEHHLLGDPNGVNVRVLQKLGYTVLKYDENGEEMHEIDWSKTKAVATRANQIYLNLVNRNHGRGIVPLEEQYELEEEIMTALYSYRDETTNKRVIACALRNRDAVLLGLGGSECGDIIYWTAEGYNMDHGDSLSTTQGYAETSVSPIFIAAGCGIKENFLTTRIIREVDVAPTVAALGGVRMPRECEGAPVYQIFSEQY